MILYSFKFLLFLLIPYVCAIIDAEHIKKEQYILDHTTRFILRSLIALIISLYSIQDAIIFSVTFWLFFDHFINWKLGKPIFYLGTVAQLDIFFSKRLWLYILLKGICLGSLIFVIIKNINIWEKILNVF